MNRRNIGAACCLAVMLGLAGCASQKTVTSDVTSYGSWPQGRPAGSYAFERLPSQQTLASQSDVENAARSALTTAGFTETDASRADFNVQVGAGTGPEGGGYPGSSVGVFGGFGGGGGRGGGFSAGGIGLSFGGGGGGYSERMVSVAIRDRKTGQTLYETSARATGSGGDEQRAFEAMFAAALKDFPATGVNPRRVVIDAP